MSAYEKALAKAQKLTSKENKEEVASVANSMKYATDNHLLTNRLVEFLADYLNQLKEQAVQLETPSSSKGDEATPTFEVPEYKGILATVGDEPAPTLEVQPEYTGGVNAVEALVNQKPAYTSNPATVTNQANLMLEKEPYRISQMSQGNLEESKVSPSRTEQKALPETGESKSETAIFLASVSLALSAAVLATKRKEE